MCWLQQFTSYYSPVRRWARQHLIQKNWKQATDFTCRLAQARLTALVSRQSCGTAWHTVLAKDRPPAMTSKQAKLHKLQRGSRTPHESISCGRRTFDRDENTNEHHMIRMARNIAWKVHSLIFNTALIPPKYSPVLTALIISPSLWMTK